MVARTSDSFSVEYVPRIEWAGKSNPALERTCRCRHEAAARFPGRGARPSSRLCKSAKRNDVFVCSWGVEVLQTRGVTTDDVGFADFFARRFERLVRACLLLTGSVAEGEDLAQEAMARVLERWDRVSMMDDPEGYLYRTALNLHRNALKRLAMATRLRASEEPAEDSDRLDRRLDLRRAIRSLPRAQREALVLVEWLGYSAEEAGPLLGIEAASVRGRLHRARESLRQRYGGLDE